MMDWLTRELEGLGLFLFYLLPTVGVGLVVVLL